MKRIARLQHCLSFAAAAFAGVFAGVAEARMPEPRMPFAFVQNAGQEDASVRFTGTGPDFKAWYKDHEVILQQGETGVRFSFVGGSAVGRPAVGGSARSVPLITPGKAIGAGVSYFHGKDPGKWRSGLPLLASITYQELWPGVDLTYKVEERRVKAEYVVAPGASVDEIRLRFATEAQIQPDGTLRIRGFKGYFVEDRPVLFQFVGAETHPVEGGFHCFNDGTIGFEAGAYDHSLPLVIDPTILYSGYFGGSSQESITSLAIDIYNNVIVAGWTSSTDLPSAGAARTRNGGGVDAFVASFAPNGGGLNWCTYLGGSGDDRAFGVAVDANRNPYVTGYSSSANFPVVGAFQARLSGTRDAFVAKLNTTGTVLAYSSYLGGSAVDSGSSIIVDNAGAAFIAGDTTSKNLAVTFRAMQAVNGGGQDGFVAKISPSGGSLAYLTYLGGAAVDHAWAIKLDWSGSVYVGGYTWSVNLPTAAAYQARNGGGQDGFLSKLSPDLSTLLFSTYLGGSGGSAGLPESVNSLFVDLLGNVVAAGTTGSLNFPVTPGAFQTRFGGATDGFVSRFSTTGQLLNSTFLGGILNDGINALTLDYHGDAYVTGYTVSQDFPLQRAVQIVNNGTNNAFVAKFDPTLATVIFGTYLGGAGNDSGNAIAVDFETSIIVAGQTSSQDFPTVGSLQHSIPSKLTSFVTKIAPQFTIGIDSNTAIVTDPWHVAWFTSTTFFGTSTDVPVVGDWDGTGRKRIGVFRNGTWLLDTNGNGYLDAGDLTVNFGQTGDLPVVGDWTGSGRIALGLFRDGTFILDTSGHLSGVSTGQSDTTYTGFGQAGDLPVAADWNGSGATKIGVFRAGSWIVDYNGDGIYTGADRTYSYGQAGDLPVTGDWDSSGRTAKIGVYRNGLWVLDYDGDNAWTVPVLNELVIGFGTYGFLPLVF